MEEDLFSYQLVLCFILETVIIRPSEMTSQITFIICDRGVIQWFNLKHLTGGAKVKGSNPEQHSQYSLMLARHCSTFATLHHPHPFLKELYVRDQIRHFFCTLEFSKGHKKTLIKPRWSSCTEVFMLLIAGNCVQIMKRQERKEKVNKRL